jgi:hypothetical protein
VISVTPGPRFASWKELSVYIGKEVGWASELVWTQRLEVKSFVFAGYRTLVVQSIVTLY